MLQQNQADIIFCIGETLEERKSNKTKEVLYNQLVRGLKDFNRFDLLILAYEPVWAIGTGVPIDIDSLLEVESFLKYTFKNEFGIENIYLLYGGSVDVDFAKKLRDNKVMDGVLVGSASWNADNFIKIIQSFV
jgi:triosephosphate isomerase